MTADTPQPLSPEEEAELRIDAGPNLARLLATIDRDRERIAALEEALTFLHGETRRKHRNVIPTYAQIAALATLLGMEMSPQTRAAMEAALIEEPRHEG